MMSQNRQAERDRLQNDFVGRAILRNEHQTRHVDAKIDHLLTYQWKRLLEIQEIQAQILQTHIGVIQRRESKRESKTTYEKPRILALEICPDELTKSLLRSYFGNEKSEDAFIFSRWHEDGDNFMGEVSNIELTMKEHIISKITFRLSFPACQATLDDLLSGEGQVTLRNDFNVPSMSLNGKITLIKIIVNGKYMELKNGELPSRYKPVFSRARKDRIIDLFQVVFDHILLAYSPPQQYAVIEIAENDKLNVTLTMYEKGLVFYSNANYSPMELLSFDGDFDASEWAMTENNGKYISNGTLERGTHIFYATSRLNIHGLYAP
jgi:hypothetical protein